MLSRGVGATRALAARVSARACSVVSDVRTGHPSNNVPENVVEKVERRLYLERDHPLGMIKSAIEAHFAEAHRDAGFKFFDRLSPVVSITDNFDGLLFPADHVSRSASDTYYVDDQHMLRTHMTTHQPQLLQRGHDAFLMTGDVYRRDSVDASHYPVFHQMDGVRVFTHDELSPSLSERAKEEFVVGELKGTLEGMVASIFGDVEQRWVDASFPFTTHSLELEVYYQDDWLEVLGCGKIQHAILERAGRGDQHGWAFGMGLERLAMRLYGIPDIRLFWSEDERFVRQFKEGTRPTFEPFSKYPPCTKDITFWVDDRFHENDFHELARSVAGDLVENVELIDDFTHPRTGRRSNCFRVIYRAMDRSLTNEEVDQLQFSLRDQVAAWGYELR